MPKFKSIRHEAAKRSLLRSCSLQTAIALEEIEFAAETFPYRPAERIDSASPRRRKFAVVTGIAVIPITDPFTEVWDEEVGGYINAFAAREHYGHSFRKWCPDLAEVVFPGELVAA